MNSADPMSAEFGTMATWTAEEARALGPDFHVPAGCRGSGGPAAMDWLLHRLIERSGDRLLDVGAGIGGPAGYARARRGVKPILVEPELAACRAARTLFGFDPICADAAQLPFRTGSYAAVWSLGVLCTVADHVGALREFARVLAPAGRLGLVIYAATGELDTKPEGNNFPTRKELPGLLASAGLQLQEQMSLDEFPVAPGQWQGRQQAVDTRVEAAHGHQHAWQESARQEGIFGDLLSSGQVIGEVLIAVPAHGGSCVGGGGNDDDVPSGV